MALDPAGRRLALSAARTVPTADMAGSRPVASVAIIEVDTGRELMRGRSPAIDARPWASAATAVDWPPPATTAGPDLGPGIGRGSPVPPGAAGHGPGVQPRRQRLAVASRPQVKLMDTETAEEVLTLRGRAELVSNAHMLIPGPLQPHGRASWRSATTGRHPWPYGRSGGHPGRVHADRMARRSRSPATSTRRAASPSRPGPSRGIRWTISKRGTNGLESAQQLLTRAGSSPTSSSSTRPRTACSRRPPSAGFLGRSDTGPPDPRLDRPLPPCWSLVCSGCRIGPEASSSATRPACRVPRPRRRPRRYDGSPQLKVPPTWSIALVCSSFIAYRSGLEPGSAIDPDYDTVARRGPRPRSKETAPSGRLALLALVPPFYGPETSRGPSRSSASHLRGADGRLRGLGAASMAIALWHEGRRDQAKDWLTAPTTSFSGPGPWRPA